MGRKPKKKLIHEEREIEISFVSPEDLIVELEEYVGLEATLEVELEENWNGLGYRATVQWRREETDEECEARVAKEKTKAQKIKETLEQEERRELARLKKKYDNPTATD